LWGELDSFGGVGDNLIIRILYSMGLGLRSLLAFGRLKGDMLWNEEELSPFYLLLSLYMASLLLDAR
jgi:hypothetical protein